VANDIQITVGVAGGQDVLKLANAITTLGNNSEKLAKQLEGGRLENSAFVKGLSQQISALTKLGVSTSDATKFIMGNAKATRESIEAAKEAKAANEAWLTTQKKMETAWSLAIQKEKELAQVEKELLASRAKLDAAAKQEANTLDQLKVKYQAGYAEMKLYKAENEQLNLAYKKNILTSAQLKVEQDKLSASFANGTGVFSKYATEASRRTNQLGVLAQQTGYQFGDFFVQLQGGTNVFVALGQQATQLVGTFAMLAKSTKWIGIFSALGIAIPIITAIAAAFSRSSEETNKTKEALTKLEEKIKSITEALTEWTLTKKASAAGMTVEEMFGVQNVDEAVKKVEAAREALRKASQMPAASIGGMTTGGLGGYESKQEKKALEDLIAAEKVLADLRKKQSEEREKTFLKEVRNLDQELNLQKTILRFGEESTQVEGMKYAQKFVNIRAELDERVKLGELERSQADALFVYYKKLADFEGLDKQVEAKKNILDYQTQLNYKIDEQTANLLEAQGLDEQALELRKQMAYEQARAEVLSKAATAAQRVEMAGAADEAGKAAVEALQLSYEVDKAKDSAKTFADHLRDAANSMNALTSLGSSIERALAVSGAKVDALKSKSDATVASTIAGYKFDLQSKTDEAIADAIAAGKSTGPILLERTRQLDLINGLQSSLTQESVLNSTNKTSGGAVAGRIDTQEEYLAKLAREYDMKKKSLGLTDEQIKRNQFLFTLDEKIATMKTKRTELEIETERKRAIAAYDAYVAAERQDALMGVVNSNINDAFMAMVDGSATVADAFRNMMFNILKSVYEQTVTQPAANAITGLLKGFLGSANGNVFSNGSHVTAYADGGVVGSPTTFSMSGGKTGLMGEAGPEAIMPLKRGSNGQLGVQVNGNAGGMTVQNIITVTGSDAAAVRMEVAKMIPQITNATKAAIIDAKRRGGQMGAAFQ